MDTGTTTDESLASLHVALPGPNEIETQEVVAARTTPAGQRPHGSGRVRLRAPALLAAVGLLIATGGPSYYLARYIVTPAGGGWDSWPYLYLFGAVAAGGTTALGLRLLRTPLKDMPWPLVAPALYGLWALVSALWSVSPSTTPLAAILNVGIMAFGCWFGWCLTTDNQIWAVVMATGAASVLSALVVWLQPVRGKMYLDVGWIAPNAEPWRGIFGNRNSLSPVCVLGLIAIVGLILRHRTVRTAVALLPLAAVEVVLLINSTGLTSLLALISAGLAVVMVYLLWLLRRLGARGVLVACVTVSAGVLAWLLIVTNLDSVLPRLGRDVTLTGRRQIWADVRDFIAVHPVRGYGFWAFWERTDLTADSYARFGAAYGSAHNSGLEVMLGLGVIGLVVYFVIAGTSIAAPFVWSWSRRGLAPWWWAAVITFLAVENLTESFVNWHSYIWVLFIAAAFVPFGPAEERHAHTPVARADAATSLG